MVDFNDPAYGWQQPNYSVGQLGGVLGQQQGAGVLGTAQPQPSSFVPFGQPDAPRPGPMSSLGLALVAGLAGGRDPQQGLAEAGQNAQYARAKMEADAKKLALNGWLKAGMPKDVQHPATIALFKAAPDLAEKYIGQQFVQQPADLTAEMKNFRAGQKDPEGFGAYDKSLHPSSNEDSPLNVGRWTLAAQRAAKPYMALSTYNLMQNASPLLARIDAAATIKGSVADQELLDAVTKLNVGPGSQVTEAQINTVLKGQSLADKVNVWQKYLSEHGGVLSDQQRQELLDVAHATFGAYQKKYQPIRDAAVKTMKDRGIPEAYWATMPDLLSLDPSLAPGGEAPAAGGGGDPLAQARDAIAKGAPRDAVIQRLQQNGIDPSGL